MHQSLNLRFICDIIRELLPTLNIPHIAFKSKEIFLQTFDVTSVITLH